MYIFAIESYLIRNFDKNSDGSWLHGLSLLAASGGLVQLRDEGRRFDLISI